MPWLLTPLCRVSFHSLLPFIQITSEKGCEWGHEGLTMLLLTQWQRAILLSSPSTELAEVPCVLKDVTVLRSSPSRHVPDTKSTNKFQTGLHRPRQGSALLTLEMMLQFKLQLWSQEKHSSEVFIPSCGQSLGTGWSLAHCGSSHTLVITAAENSDY